MMIVHENTNSTSRVKTALVTLVLLQLLFPLTVWSAPWDFGFGIDTELSQTKSVDDFPEPDQVSESSVDTLLSLTPFITAGKAGRRSRFDGRIGISHLRFTQSNEQLWQPDISLSVGVEQKPRVASLSVNTTVGRRVQTDNTRIFGDLTDPNNTTTQYGAQLEQILNQNLANHTKLEAQYGFLYSQLDDEERATVQNHSAQIQTRSVLSEKGTVAFTRANYQATNFKEESLNTSLGTVALGVEMPVDRVLKFSILTGRDWVELDEPIDDRDLFWRVSMRWEPSARFNLLAGYGQRFFGTTPTLTMEWIGRINTLSFDWTKSIDHSTFDESNFNTFLEAAESEIASSNASNEPSLDPSILSRIDDLQVTNIRSVNETINLGWEHRARFSVVSFEIGLNFESQIQDSDEIASNESRFISASVSRQFTKTIAASVSARASESLNLLDDTESNVNFLSARLGWRF